MDRNGSSGSGDPSNWNWKAIGLGAAAAVGAASLFYSYMNQRENVASPSPSSPFGNVPSPSSPFRNVRHVQSENSSPESIFIAPDKCSVDTAVNKINSYRNFSEEHLLGLDCEWISERGKPQKVALLQLGSPDGLYALIRLFKLESIDRKLEKLLEDENILKVGVGILDKGKDAKKLFDDYGLNCKGCLDLNYVANKAGAETGSLAKLAENLFGKKLNKDTPLRWCGWEDDFLTWEQIEYAVEDVKYAVKIFKHLNDIVLSENYSTREMQSWSKSEKWEHTFKMWQPYIGFHYNLQNKSANKK